MIMIKMSSSSCVVPSDTQRERCHFNDVLAVPARTAGRKAASPRHADTRLRRARLCRDMTRLRPVRFAAGSQGRGFAAWLRLRRVAVVRRDTRTVARTYHD